jgi:hypothetical protein
MQNNSSGTAIGEFRIDQESLHHDDHTCPSYLSSLVRVALYSVCHHDPTVEEQVIYPVRSRTGFAKSRDY